MKRLFFLVSIFCLCSLCSCEKLLSQREYLTRNDEYAANGSLFMGEYYNGRTFAFKFDGFSMKEGDWSFNDRITLDDEVRSGDDIREPKRIEVLSVRTKESFQIKRCLYEASLEIYIAGYHLPYRRDLKFQFEAEEIWQDTWLVAKQPFVFQRGKTAMTEQPLAPEDEDCHKRYILKFPISICDPYDGKVMYSFEYTYDVVITNETVWTTVNDDIVLL